MRVAVNKFVAVTPDNEIVGLVAASDREEAESDLAAAGYTGEIYTQEEFQETPHFAQMKLQEKRRRITGRIESLTARFNEFKALCHVDDTALDTKGLRMKRRYEKKMARLEWVLSATEEELDAYDPDQDSELEDSV